MRVYWFVGLCFFSIIQNSSAEQHSQAETRSKSSDVVEDKAVESKASLEVLSGSSVYQNLGKDWLYISLFKTKDLISSNSSKPESYTKLDFTVVSKRFSVRKFRKFWLDTVVIEHGTDLLRQYGTDFDLFFSVLEGPLKQGDQATIKLIKPKAGHSYTEFSINHQKLAYLSPEFIGLLAQGLVGTHPPSVAFKNALLGKSVKPSPKEADYKKLSPTLARVNEIANWVGEATSPAIATSKLNESKAEAADKSAALIADEG